MCREPVHAEARRCHSCGQWLGARGRLVSGLVVLALVGFAYVLVSIMLDLPSPFHRKLAPAQVVEQLVVVDSTVRFTQQGECAFVSTVGTLRNESTDIAADDVYVEVRYFDAEGALIDAEGAEQYGLVVLPGAEAAFSVRGRASSGESDYASHRVTVVSAEEARFR
jgi:hypothetical protein